jgi:chromate reductase, NAD(P)H dehydrogenase (quinone)
MEMHGGTLLRVLGLVGSLRAGSLNRGLMDAAREMAPEHGMEIEVFERLREIPPYDADLDARGDPEAVGALKAAIRAADALLIASPEYNYSVPGVLKNAIDWASRPPPESPLRGKPAAIMGASGGISGTMRMQYHLRQIFVFTQTHVLLAPEVIIPRAAERFQDGRLADESTRALIGKQLAALREWTLRLSPRV